jgi:HrpA-like RNA helicase
MMKSKDKKKKKAEELFGIYDTEGININPLNGKEYSEQYKQLTKFWSNLPAYENIDDCIDSIKSNDVILVSSGTGSGKTVLFPKFALHANDYKGKIIVTLPKKLITKSAAEFAAKTLDVELGNQVGYQYKGESIKSSGTNLLYATDGSIISMIKSDPLIQAIDIILIDEAHERKTQIDILLYLIKNAIIIRKEKNMKPLKLIIMSATIEESIFRDYFTNLNYDYVHLSGKPNFPIEEYFLKDSIMEKSNKYIEVGLEKIEEIVKKDNNNSDTLFFVTTVKECDDTADKLEYIYNDSFVMPLYSGIPSSLEEIISNKDKYKEINPNYRRRIFVATNVAESSLTIDGIVYVIDAGLEVNVIYDASRKINIMNTSFITKAQMAQRKGRAGRTQNGFCYHLYTKEEMEKAIDYPDPEIKLIDLKNLCLSLLILGDDLNKKIKQDLTATTHAAPTNTASMSDADTEGSYDSDSASASASASACASDKYSQSSLDIKTELEIMRGGDGKVYVEYDRFTVNDAKKIFENFIQPPKKEYIDDGFDFLIRNNLVSKDLIINKLGRLINISRLDVQDALSLVYAYNISKDVFDAVFLIICAYTKIKSMDELFFNDKNNEKDKNNRNIKDSKIAKEIMKDSNNSDHVFIYNVFKRFNKMDGKNNKVFNTSTLKSIQKLFEYQKKTLYSLYKRFDYKLYNNNNNNNNKNKKGGYVIDQENYANDIIGGGIFADDIIDQEDDYEDIFAEGAGGAKGTFGGGNIEKDIILSFCFGFKDNIINRNDKQVIFNNILCDTTKTFVDTSKANKFIFYSNVLIKNKLYVGIVSPYISK